MASIDADVTAVWQGMAMSATGFAIAQFALRYASLTLNLFSRRGF
jgi:hypothetical protein